MGKNREEDEETFVHDEEGERKEIMEIPEKFVGTWVYNIYQKLLRPDFSFWHKKGEKWIKC